MFCRTCGAKRYSDQGRFCTKCGVPVQAPKLIAPRSLLLPLILIGRALAYPIRRWQERIRWLTEASGPDSPINHVPRFTDNAKRVYAYLADVTLRFGASHSRIRTIAHVAGISQYKARKAIRELETRGLLSHKRRKTWHGRGANDYRVRPVR